MNPAREVKTERFSRTEGKTPAFVEGEVQRLLGAIETSTHTGLRDRALLGVLAYTFARIGSVVNLKVEDYYPSGKRFLLRFKEKGGKEKSGETNKRLDFSYALVSPQAAYDRAIEIIGRGDKLAWRRLLNSAALKAADTLAEWRQRSAQPPDNSAVLKHALAGANTAGEFIACLVAAAETEEESYSSDLGWIHTIRTSPNWPTGGYTYFVDFPLVILFIAQAVVGGALMEHGLGETALRVALFKIPQRYDNNPLAIFEATSVNGWPKALNGDSSIAWNLLNSVLEQWEWLKTGLAPNRTPQSGIIAYYSLLHFLRFARLAKNGISAENPLIIPEIFSAPLWFLQWRAEEDNMGYWLLLKQATLLNRILDQEHINKEILNREWPKWMKHVLQWFRPGSMYRKPAFASLPQDLDVGNWSG